jgi:hypothetical protein
MLIGFAYKLDENGIKLSPEQMINHEYDPADRDSPPYITFEQGLLILKEIHFLTQQDVINRLIKFSQSNANLELYGIGIYNQSKSGKFIILYSVTAKGRIKKTRILNPMWEGLYQVTIMNRVNFAPTHLGMFDRYVWMCQNVKDGDQIVLTAHHFSDTMQSAVYDCDDQLRENSTPISCENMGEIFQRVCLEAVLPVLKLEFKSGEKSCYFAWGDVKPKKGDISKLINPSMFTSFGHQQKSVVSIDKMKIVMQLNWGMYEETILHEAAHYIAYFLPTTLRFNQAEYKVSYAEYELIFSSHGLLFCSIFHYLLKQYSEFSNQYLAISFKRFDIKFVDIDSLNEHAITNEIISYLKSLPKKE